MRPQRVTEQLLEIVHEDADFVVVDKESGMLAELANRQTQLALHYKKAKATHISPASSLHEAPLDGH